MDERQVVGWDDLPTGFSGGRQGLIGMAVRLTRRQPALLVSPPPFAQGVIALRDHLEITSVFLGRIV